MTRNSKTNLACFLALAASGCMTVGEDDLPEVDSDPDLGVAYLGCASPGCGEQGRTLLSAVLDADGYVSFPLRGKVGATTHSLKITPDGVLQLASGAPLPSGLVLKASNNASVEVALAATPPGQPGPQYALTYTKGTFKGNPCANGNAIAMDGDFDARAHHDEDTLASAGPDHRFSFACAEEGTAWKCVNWGFVPGNDWLSPDWKGHQVCTRAARADYCKDGTSHTLDETHVRIWDDYPNMAFDEPNVRFPGLNVWPPPVDVFKFESVWPESEGSPVACLNKERWHALEPGELDATCSNPPPDPRTDVNARFCEEGRPDVPSNSITFESIYNDLLLEDWEYPGFDRSSSISGYVPGDASPRVRGKRPFENAAGYAHVQTLGTLLRSLPGSIDKTEVIDVFTYDEDGDRVLGGDAVAPDSWTPSSYDTREWEGMVFANPPASGIPATAKLHVYESTKGDLYNGLEKADEDDTEVGTIGYIPVFAE